MNREIDFSTVLASSVHDMKNSLALVLQQLENVAEETQDLTVGPKVAQLYYEAQRINSNLVHLLHLYRYQQQNSSLNVDCHYLDEIVEELVMNNQLYLEQKAIALEVNIAEDCYVYCDRDLIINLLNDIVINAMRYTADKLVITAVHRHDGQVTIEIADNGPGYPEQMLDAVTTALIEPNESSRTGLGIYFAQQIAAAHQRAGKKGFIELENGGHLGGSVFKLTLP
ncbi:MAG: sensor histidine kinase [Pseudomonadota bacterium]